MADLYVSCVILAYMCVSCMVVAYLCVSCVVTHTGPDMAHLLDQYV